MSRNFFFLRNSALLHDLDTKFDSEESIRSIIRIAPVDLLTVHPDQSYYDTPIFNATYLMDPFPSSLYWQKRGWN